jgi:hypothetical protein
MPGGACNLGKGRIALELALPKPPIVEDISCDMPIIVLS